jgi:hypothetical protein
MRLMMEGRRSLSFSLSLSLSLDLRLTDPFLRDLEKSMNLKKILRAL